MLSLLKIPSAAENLTLWRNGPDILALPSVARLPGCKRPGVARRSGVGGCNQSVKRDEWRTGRHTQAGGRITHPGGKLAGDAWSLLDHEHFHAIAPGAPMSAKPLSMQRMPWILDPDGSQRVC